MKKFYNFQKLLFILLFVGLYTPAKSQVPSQSTDVMLQGFGWDTYSTSSWANLTNMAPEIGQHFDLIWLPPSGNDLGTNTMGYLPVYYFDQNSSFGTQNELKNLIQTLNANGTKAIADVVINHRNGQTNWVDFPDETYNSTTYSWGLEAICQGDEVKDQTLSYPHIPQGNPDTGENYGAARDIDHTNLNVQNTIKAYLGFLKNDIGYDGWRYDLVKGYDGSYTATYNNSANAYFSVGEFWDGNYDYVTGWIDATNATSTAFDFPEKYALNNAFNNGYNLTELVWKRNGTLDQPAGLIHHDYYRKYAVTFVDNHDTGRADNPSRFTGNVLAAYAFILSSPGIPCVWMNHWNDNNYKTKINELIDARKLVQLHSESNVTINQSSADSYVATATGLNGSLIVKIGTGTYDAPADYTLSTSGQDYAVWTKVNSTPPNPNSITVRFYNNNTVWNSVNVHGWDDSQSLTTWPGETMTDEGNGWFSYTFSNVTGALNVIFNNGTEQTQDITNITADACFSTLSYKDGSGKWPQIEVSCADGTSTEPISVAYQNTENWTNVYIYSWEADGSLASGAWPGTQISEFQTGWYRYDFNPSIQNVNVIFNDGGMGAQTGDILGVTSTRCFSGLTPDIVDCPSVVTSVATVEQENNKIEVYPNPVKESIHILSSNQIEKVLIAAPNGSIVDIFESPVQSTQFNVSKLQPGLYFIIVQDNKGKETTGRFIKK